jgi:hypothetical protein
VLVVGLAVTELPVVADKPVAGVQLYVVAPPAVSDVELPAHIVGELTEMVGNGFTVTIALPETVPAHLLSTTETNTYVVVFVGETVIVYGDELTVMVVCVVPSV